MPAKLHAQSFCRSRAVNAELLCNTRDMQPMMSVVLSQEKLYLVGHFNFKSRESRLEKTWTIHASEPLGDALRSLHYCKYSVMRRLRARVVPWMHRSDIIGSRMRRCRHRLKWNGRRCSETKPATPAGLKSKKIATYSFIHRTFVLSLIYRNSACCL